MDWTQLALLDELGFSIYEKKALAALVSHGVADAATMCRDGDIPTSKIYRAMERLADLGVAEIQPTRPRMYAALPADVIVDRLADAARSRAEGFASRVEGLREVLSGFEGEVAGRQTFADLALGVEAHVKRHLVRLSSARKRIISYMEEGDLDAISSMSAAGLPVLRRVGRNTVEHGVDHRVVFGFTRRGAPKLVEFLKAHSGDLSGATGVRYSGHLGHPFHVVDEELVVLSLDHPFVPEGRFASLMIKDVELARKLTHGFEELWSKAMHDLREIRFHPAG